MSLPIHTSPTTARPTTLAQAVAQVRHPRNRATAQLTPHREELLRLHQAGESPETLASGLRLIGVEIGRETMRRWLDRELGRKPARRRKGIKRRAPEPAPFAAPPTVSAPVAPAPSFTAPVTIISEPPTAPVGRGADEPVMEGTALIRPCEKPSEAFRRRRAEMEARKLPALAAGPEPRDPRIEQSDI